MSFPFRHTWHGQRRLDIIREAEANALTEAAIEGVFICQSPAPTGWPRRTGFLANSTGFEEAVEEDDGLVSQITVQAHYWIYVEGRTKVLSRAGEAVARTLGDRVRKHMP